MDIFYKIISYLNDIIIQDRKKVGWKEINEEVHLVLSGGQKQDQTRYKGW